MSFLGDFFGGGESTTTPTKVSQWTPQQEALMRSLTGKVRVGVNAPVPVYQGDMYTPRTPEEQSYFDFMGGQSYEGSAYQNAMGNILAGKPAYDVDPAVAEQFYQQSIRAPALKEFRETTMPLLTEQFSGPSFWSSNRADQTRKAVENLGDTLSARHGELMYGEELARRTALDNAMNRVTGAGESYSKQMGTAGGYARQIENERIASELQRYLSGEEVGGVANPAYNPQYRLALALLGLTPYAIGATTTSSGPGLGFGILSGMAEGAGAAATSWP